MEYARGGDLLKYTLKHYPSPYQEDHARWIFQQLIVGLDYCHQMVNPCSLRRFGQLLHLHASGTVLGIICTVAAVLFICLVIVVPGEMSGEGLLRCCEKYKGA